MPLLEVKDPATGSIKPWVWVLGAGFAIGGAALFLGSGQGGGSGSPTSGEGLGTSGGLDELQQALEELNDRIDDLEPNPPGTSPPPGGGGGIPPGEGGGLPYRPPRGVPTPIDSPFRPEPTSGGIGVVSPFSGSGGRLSDTSRASSGGIGIVNPFAGSSSPTRSAPATGGGITNPFTATSQTVSNITKVISGSTIGAVSTSRTPTTSALEPTSGRVTRRTSAVSTGSINPYPISIGVNPASPEACRRSPVHSDI